MNYSLRSLPDSGNSPRRPDHPAASAPTQEPTPANPARHPGRQHGHAHKTLSTQRLQNPEDQLNRLLADSGLKRIAGQVARGFHGDIDDFDADLLEGFFVGLNMVDPDKPKVYSSLRWMPLRYGVEARNKEDRLYAQRELTEPGAFHRYQRNATGHQDLVLARAVGNGVLRREDADLVGCVRIDGEDLTTASERRGIPYHQARKRLAFAEWRLAGYLGVPVPRPAA